MMSLLYHLIHIFRNQSSSVDDHSGCSRLTLKPGKSSRNVNLYHIPLWYNIYALVVEEEVGHVYF